MNRLLATALVGLVLAAAVPAQAQSGTFFGTFSGAAENPANGSPGTGSVMVTLDTGPAHELRVDLSFSGLLSPTTVAHIHCCLLAPAVNVGVATTTPTFVGFPAGVTSGTYSAVFDTEVASTFNAAFVTANGGVGGAEAALFAALMAGNAAYFNIHTQMFPAGEIRANLAPVPEPASYALLLAGLAGVALAARRRRG